MLEYENQLLLDLLHDDALLVLAKGLGLERIFLNVLRSYGEGNEGQHSGNLVLVLGTRDEEEDYFIQNAGNISIRKVTSEISINERSSMYKAGGIYFMSTRILTVDLLKDRLPASLITGLLVYRAHHTADSCQETFVLRLYRQKNKTGFIKAFSDAPSYFKSGAFRKTERIMRNLFVRNLILCPRFQIDVCSTLEKNPPEVIELHLHMTTEMLTLQTAILDLMDFTLKEIKRINPQLYSEDDEVTLKVENAISKSFIKNLQRELDPIWHRLSWKTKQLIQDMKTLRTLLLFLTQYDAVTFHGLVSALRTTENAMKTGGWMLLDSAETLFLTAETRLTGSKMDSTPKKPKLQNFYIEENPKWLALSDILREIKENISPDSFPTEKILILTSDSRTARQLEEYLSTGAQKLLRKLFNKSVALTDKFGRLDNGEGEVFQEDRPRKNKGGVGKKSSKSNITLTETKDKDLNFVESPLIVVQSFQVDPFERFKVLNEIKPRYVIMYDVDLTTVRQLEVYQANEGPNFKIRVYFMFYGKSVEEQAFLTTIRSEKEAFEHLIKEKETMVIPEDREGRSEVTLNSDLLRGSEKASDTIVAQKQDASSNTRQGGITLKSESAKIIVDMREFRCELPSLIHKRGIDIEPITLEVGDYILTPEICVERKSISDLIGSLNCGRLYTQATSMTRFYTKPMLLIEFDKNKPFALQGRYYMSKDIASSDVVMRLQLLTLHFPRLVLLWSPSPHATAEIFEELKKGRDEPDSSRASSISIDIADEFQSEKYNPAIFDFVSKLPGVTTRNVYSILNSVSNLGDLFDLTEEGISELLESKIHGKLLYEALHCKMEAAEPIETKKSNPSSSRFKHKIKRK
uniref:DNA repair endonuclease XPF n=2 Tax=Lepeophtheirus salmonis TaxID=72036 RepID=A0A0K2T0T9_LEPSM